jgi:hypothetical protein
MPRRRASRDATRRLGSAVLGLLLLTGCGRATATPAASATLALGVSRLGSCAAVDAGPSRWHEPIEAGLNSYYDLPPDTAQVLAVRLTGVHNLRLVGADFVTLQNGVGAVGFGFSWPLTRDEVPTESGWQSVRPAVGTVFTPGTVRSVPVPAGTTVWQLVVGIAPLSGQGGYATGEEVVFQTGGHQYTVTDHAAVAVPGMNSELCRQFGKAIDSG